MDDQRLNREPAPIFAAIAVDDHGRLAKTGWAGETGYAEAARAGALDALLEAAGSAYLYVRDPLLEEAYLMDACAAAGRDAPCVRDWMTALAPFGQARELSAFMVAARAQADDGPGAGARAHFMWTVFELMREQGERT